MRVYFSEILIVLALAPVAALITALRYRRLGSWRPAVVEVAAWYGTLPWLAMVFTPGPGDVSRVNLVPLRDLEALAGAPARVIVVQMVGNLLVFAAAGFFLPLRYAALRSVPRMFLLGAAGSAVIETTQYVARLGRVSSVDDVLINALGAALFAAASRPWWRSRES